MPQLGVAKDFFDRYTKLEKPVQRAVKEALKKFNEHTHAGVHLEKLEGARDPRLRTIRITLGWRGIVLAQPGGQHCLLDVVKHDVADREAPRRRYTVNNVLGVMEVRDQQAIDDLTPTFSQTAQAAETRLFDDFKDSVLRELGIDTDVLRLARTLTSTEQLEALANLIPPRQYDALFGLATGMSPDEVWAEVSRYLVDTPDKVDPDDLVAAMKRTPDQYVLVGGTDELTEMLSKPFEAWKIFLHPRQREIARRPSYSGPVLVTGGAGTGKTVTAVHRAAFLAERYRQTDGAPPILLTTFTRNLAEALENQVASLVSDEKARSRIDILNVDRLAHQILNKAHGARPTIASYGTLAELWQGAADGSEFSATFLQREWEQVILAQNLADLRAYQNCDRHGRGKGLRKDSPHREHVWQAINGVLDHLRASGEQTHPQVAQEAADILTADVIRPYRHVIVDEGQDLHPAHWRLLRAAVAPGPDDLFIVADPNQRIYDNRVSLEQLGIRVRGRSRRLTISYRTTQEILSWSRPILTAEPAPGLDDQPDRLTGYHSERHGKRPTVHPFPDWHTELDALTNQVRQWLADGVEASSIGIAARTKHAATDARKALQAAEIPTVSAQARTRDAVRADTMHRMKGVEFRCVAVINVDDDQVPQPAALTDAGEDSLSHQQDLQRERCLLFVACTRARDFLYISHRAGHSSPFLPNQPGHVHQ